MNQKVDEFITFSAERASVQTLLMSWELTCMSGKHEICFIKLNA
jgi:hypothetical protein